MTKSTPGNLHPNDPDNVWPDDGSEDRARAQAPDHAWRCLDCGGAGEFVINKGAGDRRDNLVQECKSCGGTGRAPASEG